MAAGTKKRRAWPIDNIQRRALADLKPDPKNSREHSDEQVEQIARLIDEFGWTMPILIRSNGTIIAGEGRYLAAQLRGIEEVPVIVAAGWSRAQIKAYVIADNKVAENSTWDLGALRTELGDLQALGFDISITGFDSTELQGIFNPAQTGKIDPDADAPPPPVDPVTKPGDVWMLGRHRIICGDSTDAATVAAVLAGAKPHLMVTDPPYGVGYDPNWRNEAARTSVGMGNRAIGAGAVGKVMNDDRADWREAWALFEGDVVYVWHGALHAPVVGQSLLASGFVIRSQIIWDKTRLIIGRGDYHWEHEPCWYAVRKGATGHWAGDRKQTTVWRIPHQRSETGHGTQKPVECMRRPIENNSRPGDAVYEPFSGSGTTIIACEMAGRLCYAIELDPAYVDVAVRRWCEFTGQQATRESDGMVFPLDAPKPAGVKRRARGKASEPVAAQPS